MKSSIKHIVLILILIACSLAAAFFIGRVAKDNKEHSLFISFSVMSGLVDVPVEVSVSDEKDKLQRNVLTIPFTANNTLLYDYKKVKVIDSLNVRIHHNKEVHISHFSISQNDFTASYSVERLIEHVEFYNATTVVNDDGVLVLIPNKNADKYGFYFKKPIELKSREFYWPYVKNTFWIVFGCLIIVYVFRKLNAIRVLKAVFPALIITGLGYLMLTALQESVTNASIEISGSTDKSKIEKIELYFSPDGSFDLENLLIFPASKLNKGNLKIKLPDNVHRYFRVDLPKNDSLIISSIKFQGWFFEKTISGKEIFNYFPATNDLGVGLMKNNDALFLTGSDDPFIMLFNPGFQFDFTFCQIKKKEYPIWMSIILFCLLITAFSFKGNKKQLTFLILFFLVLLIPSVTFFVKQDNVRLDSEKRFGAPKPKNWKSTLELKNQTDNYIKDQFGGREKMITNWNILNIMSFKQTSGETAVKFGKNDWMFYTGEGMVDIYENKTPISEDTLKIICDNLEERREWLALYGIDYYVTFPPMKHTMYSEFLPARIRKRNEFSKQDQVLEYLKKHSKIKTIDIRPTLFAAKKKEKHPLYYSCDTHWNILAGWYSSKTIINRMNSDHPEVGKSKERNDFEWTESKTNEGDLAKLLALNEYYLRPEIISVPKKGYNAKLKDFVWSNSYEGIRMPIVYETGDKNQLKLLVHRDSYSNFLMPFMSEHFQRSTYLWTPLFCPKIIKVEKPDIVMSEVMERFIEDLSIENPPIMKRELERARSQKKEK